MEISDQTTRGNYDHDHHHTGAVAFPMCLAVDQMDDDNQRVERTSTTDDQHDQAGGVSDHHLVNYQAAADVSTETELGLFFPTAKSHDDVDFPNMEKYFDDQNSFYLGAACNSFIIREADACLQQIDHHHHPLINIEKDHADDHHDQYSFDNINNSLEQCQKIRNSSVMIFRRSCDQSAARLRSRSSDRDAGRSCVVCHTTKTPLWRGGPKGPKSLCNACGIRQRKARRAALMAAAATAASGDQVEAVSLSDDHSTTNIIINNAAGMITKKKVGRKSRDHHHHTVHEFDHDQDMNMNSSAAAQQLHKMLMVRRPRNKLLHIQKKKKKKKKKTKETSSSAAANLIQMTNYSDDQLLFGTRITGRFNTANPKDLLLHQAAGFNDQKAGTGTGQLVINFSSSSTSTNRRSAFNRVFPKDEEEGAVLLMALSCGGRDYS